MQYFLFLDSSESQLCIDQGITFYWFIPSKAQIEEDEILYKSIAHGNFGSKPFESYEFLH